MPEKKILVIDADAASRNFITRQLTGQKYEVIQAGSAKEGLIFAWRDRPDLVVIDPTITDITGEELARKLKQDARTANMPLIALSSDPSMARIRSCLDAGFGDFIPKSGQAITALIETVNRLLTALAMAAKKQGGLLIIFQGVKGGIGTSSICANIAMNIAQSQPQARVVVMDMVQPIGSIASIVGYEGAQNIVTVADMVSTDATPQFFRDTLFKVNTWRFNLLAGSPDPESATHLKSGRITDIILALKEVYDYILIDIGRLLSRITVPLIQSADLNILIISPDTSAVSMARPIVEYMKSKGVDTATLFTILNRAAGLDSLSKGDVEKKLGIPVMAAVPYLSSNMALAISQHQPFTLKFPKDTAALVFQETAKEIFTLARKLRSE